jgi:hypothetical protein
MTTKENENKPEVDKGLISMFLKMTVEERLLANDNAVIAILELKDAFRTSSKDPKDHQRLPVLEETLQQIKQDKPS